MTAGPPPSWRLNWQTWVGLLSLGLALWLVVTYAGLLLEVFLLLFGALLLSLAIRPVVDGLASWRVPRGVSVLGVYLALGCIVALAVSSLVPILRNEVKLVQHDGPTLVREAVSWLKTTPVGGWVPSSDALAQNLSQHLDALLRTVVSTATDVGRVALDLLVVLALTYFIATDADLVERLLARWVPTRHQSRARVITAHLQERLGRWVWAQVAIALYFALVFSAGLGVLGVPFALTIGVVGGVLELVPYLGGVVAWLLAVISALTKQPLLIVWVSLFYVVVVEVEAHVVAPAFYGRIIGLHPAAVLIALLVGAKAKGILGVLFAVPVTVVLTAILQEVRVGQEPQAAVAAVADPMEEE